MGVKTLLIDNLDSYTFNLYQLIAEVNQELPVVIRNSDLSLDQVKQLILEKGIHNIVVSPGPGTPAAEADIGVCNAVLQQLDDVPILGVCLGHQALAHVHGGRVVHAPEPVHGRLSKVQFQEHELFAGIDPQGFDVVRYHSLVVDAASLPSCLVPLAWISGTHHALELPAAGEAAAAVGKPAQQQAAEQANGYSTQQEQQEQQEQQQGSLAGRRRPYTHEASTAGAADAADAAGAAITAAAGSEAGLIMALAHRSRPHYGVQFHPESIATRYGVALLQNFRDLSCKLLGLPAMAPAVNPVGPPGQEVTPAVWPPADATAAAAAAGAAIAAAGVAAAGVAAAGETAAGETAGAAAGPGPGSSGHLLELHVVERRGVLQVAGGSQALFEHLLGPCEDTFWLDSAASDRGRFSYMGGRGGALWHRLTYKLPPAARQQQPGHSSSTAAGQGASSHTPVAGTLTTTRADGSSSTQQGALLDHLQQQLAAHRLSPAAWAASAKLPFDFCGGYVGYLGYELKAECGARLAHDSPHADAALLFADRLLAVDHWQGDVVLLALCAAEQRQEAQHWLSSTAAAVDELTAAAAAAAAGASAAGANGHACNGSSSTTHAHSNGFTHSSSACGASQEQAGSSTAKQQVQQQQPFKLRHGHSAYLANIAACQAALHDGDSYEVCLTTAMSRRAAPEPWQLYTTLRTTNPAPYAAWLHFGPAAPTICCSSPERFLKCGRGGVLEARPIKGTAPRSKDPVQDARAAAALAASEKDRAENLMIVDLLRNDLGRVCTVGSVHVPGLMEVESFATVHQLVSTVRGARREGASSVECIRAAFPGGSMTGAPKVRTMEIIDRLEGGARGVYSGSVGYLSVNDTFDLNIVIRTAVVGEEGVSIGAGGAIVVQSESEGEFEEMVLKARALLRAVGQCDGGAGPAELCWD